MGNLCKLPFGLPVCSENVGTLCNASLTKIYRFHFPFSDAKSMPKDEEYAKGCVKGNMIYKIHWTDPPTLMPVENMCGHIPQVAILDTKEVICELG